MQLYGAEESGILCSYTAQRKAAYFAAIRRRGKRHTLQPYGAEESGIFCSYTVQSEAAYFAAIRRGEYGIICIFGSIGHAVGWPPENRGYRRYAVGTVPRNKNGFLGTDQAYRLYMSKTEII